MNAIVCPFCSTGLPRQEVANGWCETCGKKLPPAIIHRTIASMSQGPLFGTRGDLNQAPHVAGRGWGFLILILGGFFSYWSVYCPLASAMRHEARISLSVKGVIVSTLCLVLGLVLTIFGKRAGTVLYVSPRRLSGAGFVLCLATTTVGFLAFLLLKATVENYGYRF